MWLFSDDSTSPSGPTTGGSQSRKGSARWLFLFESHQPSVSLSPPPSAVALAEAEVSSRMPHAASRINVNGYQMLVITASAISPASSKSGIDNIVIDRSESIGKT